MSIIGMLVLLNVPLIIIIRKNEAKLLLPRGGPPNLSENIRQGENTAVLVCCFFAARKMGAFFGRAKTHRREPNGGPPTGPE